jgi:acyl-CoA synthetase (AMP-forming)/AMP-acid ligase II
MHRDQKQDQARSAEVAAGQRTNSSQDQISASCRRRLLNYKCPSELQVVEQLPITAAHKLDHVALRWIARSE